MNPSHKVKTPIDQYDKRLFRANISKKIFKKHQKFKKHFNKGKQSIYLSPLKAKNPQIKPKFYEIFSMNENSDCNNIRQQTLDNMAIKQAPQEFINRQEEFKKFNTQYERNIPCDLLEGELSSSQIAEEEKIFSLQVDRSS